MKILHIINNLNTGGAEKLLLDILPLFKNYNIDADLLILNPQSTPFLEILKQCFTGHIYQSPITNLYSPLQLIYIRKILKQHYDIIHVHLFPSLYWAALAMIGHRQNTSLIFTEHSTYNRRLNNIFWRWIDRLIYRQYDAIIAITPQVKQALIHKLSIPSTKINVIWNGIHLEQFSFPESLNFSVLPPLSKKNTVLIQISRFRPEKDQDTLIRALAVLPKHYLLLLVGEGPRLPLCQELAHSLGLTDRVHFLGTRMDIPALLHNADIVIQSSHWEGFGLSAVEGMAAGKPVIASDVAGLRDIVAGAGLLFPKGDAQALANQIKLLSSPSKYQKIAEQCQLRAKIFHISNMMDSIVALYRKYNKYS